MKNHLLLLITILFFNISFSQQEFKKKYCLPNIIKYSSEDNEDGVSEGKETKLFLKKDDTKVKGEKSIVVDDIEFSEIIINNVEYDIRVYDNLYGNVLFEEDTLWVNPWLMKKVTSDKYAYQNDIFYYKLQNRQSLKLDYTQWSLTALTVPLKVRFSNEAPTVFSADVNVGALIGKTWGNTNFVHRKKVGNKTYDRKHTVGGFWGISALDFKYDENIPQTDMMMEMVEPKKIEVKTAAISIGLGYTFSYDNLSAAFIVGVDYGLDSQSGNWAYQGKPWIGAGVGYSLFSF